MWAGDVASVALETAGVGYSDLRLFRRALVMFARSAREDGLVAGLCPGTNQYISTFAAQWQSACLRYYQLTGDKDLLVDLFPAAERNIAAFEGHLTPQGVTDEVGWGFVDWGYVRNPGEADIAVNMHFLAAVRDMVRSKLSVPVESLPTPPNIHRLPLLSVHPMAPVRFPGTLAAENVCNVP